jgi:hypothetical protein
VAWGVTFLLVELLALAFAAIINAAMAGPLMPGEDKSVHLASTIRGFLVAIGLPTGLAPPFIPVILALAVGIPLQRRAMRLVHAIALKDDEVASLRAEIESMGAEARDPSRTGRLIAVLVAIAIVEVLVIGPVLITGLGPNPAGALIVLVFGSVVGASPAFLFAPIGAALAAALPLQRKATQSLSRVHITDAERESLLKEMHQVGLPIRKRQRSDGLKIVAACVAAWGVMSAFVLVIALVVAYGIERGGLGPNPVATLLILIVSPVGAAPPFIPVIVGYFVGKPLHYATVQADAGALAITPKDAAELTGELEKTAQWVGRMQSKKRNEMLIAGLVTYVVMVAATLAIYGIGAAFVPMLRQPGPAFFLLLIPPMVCLPPFLPLFLGLAAGLPLRRRMKETGPLFMG